MKKEAEFHVSEGQYLTMKTTHTVQMRDKLRLLTGDGKGTDLDITISADFEKIPPKYHQLFCQMMQVRYGGIVNIWDNTQPFAKPKDDKRKWYQFWKSK